MAKYSFERIAINSTEKKMPSDDDRLTYVGLEHLDSGSLYVTRWGSLVPLKGEKLVMHKGDVLLGKRNAYLRRAAIAPHDGIFSAHGMVLKPCEDVIDKGFFPLFIASDYFFDEAIRISVGSLSPTVNWKDLRLIQFELPPLEEQRKLAEVLWAINDAMEAYKRLISATDELISSQFVEMFGNPIRNSKHYPTEKLALLGELNRGVSKARPRNSPELLGGPYPLIQTGEIAASGLYIDKYESTYSEAGLAQSKMWPKGTLCITIAANIAKTGILAFDACFPDSVVGFIAGERVTQLYIHYWFSFFQKILEEQAPQVAQKNINLKILSELEVMLPPMSLQERFAAFVEQSDKSQFVEMFGNPVDNRRAFPICTIGTFTDVLTGATPSRKNDSYYNGTIPWVKTGEIEKRYIETTEEYITDLALKETNCKLLPVDTVMVAMYGQGKTRGQSGILRIKAATNQACAAILPCADLHPIFLHHFLLNEYERLRQLGRGAQQANLNLSMIKNYPIMKVPISLQERFAAFVEQSDKSKLRCSLRDLGNLRNFVMKKCFTDKL